MLIYCAENGGVFWFAVCNLFFIFLALLLLVQNLIKNLEMKRMRTKKEMKRVVKTIRMKVLKTMVLLIKMMEERMKRSLQGKHL